MLDRVRGRDGDQQRLRVGVADVLGGEDDHPPGDEPRVLAALEHRREVVERRVGVRAARRLDPGRDVVVVLVAGLVVEDRLALHRVLGVGDRDRPAVAARRGLARELERVERRPRVAARARGEEGDRVVVDRRRRRTRRASSARRSSPSTSAALERVQLVDLGAGEQRRVDLEVRVLRRRADERDQPLLDRRQQRVLLRLVEAVDLVEEEDRRAPAARAARRARAITSRTSGRPALTAESSSKAASACSAVIRASVVLPVPGGPYRTIECGRPGLDRRAQRRALAEQVLLPDEVVERARPHARGERPVDRRRLGARPAPRARSGSNSVSTPAVSRSIALAPDARAAAERSLREWGRLGLIGFGGPPAHVALLRELIVERRGWIEAREFEDANAACQLLPGPGSTQLAIYCAQRVAGLPGALAGGLAFILPGPADGARDRRARARRGAAGVDRSASAPAPARRWSRSSRRRASCSAAARSPAGATSARRSTSPPASPAVVLAGAFVVLVLRRRRACSSSPGAGARRAALHAWPVALAAAPRRCPGLAWTAFKVGALSYGGGFVIIPLMQEDAVDRHGWMTEAEFLNAVAFGQLTPGPVTHTVALVGWAAAGLGGALLASRDRVRAVVPRGRPRRRRASGGCAATGRRARSSTAPARPPSARSSGAAVPLAAALAEWWQGAVLVAAALAARCSAARRSGRSRAARSRGSPWRSPAARCRDAATVSCMDLQAEATDVLSRLIRFDTVNPPGDERACQEWLKGYLEDAGLECELPARRGARAPEPRRAAARRGRRPGARLPLARRHGARRRRPTGATTRGRARCTTARSGAAARST